MACQENELENNTGHAQVGLSTTLLAGSMTGLLLLLGGPGAPQQQLDRGLL